MLSAIREIGRWQRDKYGKDELDTLVQEPFKPGGKIVSIRIDTERNDFDGVELEDYDSSKKMKYLFRKGPPNGTNPIPTAKITDIKKTFENKIQKWFEKNRLEEKQNFLENIKNILSYNKDKITKEIQTYIKDIDKEEGKLLTIKIKENGDWKYIGDFEIFRKSLKEIETKKTVGISASNNKYCSICGMQKPLIF